MPAVEFELTNKIERNYIENIGNKLDDMWKDDGDKLYLHIRDCSGGNLEPVIELIKRIQWSGVPVEITASGYVMSAAAYLYFKLLEISDEYSFINVVMPELPIRVVYHKPNIEGQHVPELSDEPDSESAYKRLVEFEGLTDELFDSIADRLGWKNDKIEHDYHYKLELYSDYANVEFSYPAI